MNISIVVQRYGENINGGAELHARFLAERLAKKHEVTILTTQATSYHAWENDIEETEEVINGVKVLRYSSMDKSHTRFRKFRRLVLKNRKHQRWLKKIGLFNLLDKKGVFEPTEEDFASWLMHQGPYCTGLTEYIKANESTYDIFIFFTYLYYPTNAGLPLVAEKSILVPTAHDEETFYIKGYDKLFEKPAFIMYNSHSEKRLVENTYPTSKNTKNEIAGVGIDSFAISKNEFSVPYEYIIYIGRIDKAKNADELIDWFTKYNKIQSTKMKLVLVGNNVSKLVGDEHIIFTGFISEEEKYNWLNNAKALVIPSLHESLSMVTLEAMIQGIPVIANANCEVLDDHIKQSKAGYSYFNYSDFIKIMDNLNNLSAAERTQMGENGKTYVNKYYQWDGILQKFEDAFKLIANK